MTTLAEQQAELMTQISRTMMTNAQQNYAKTLSLLESNSLLNQRQNEMAYERYTKINNMNDDIQQTQVKSDTYARQLEYAVDDTAYYERRIRFLRHMALIMSFGIIFLLFLAFFDTKFQKPTNFIAATAATVGVFILRIVVMVLYGLIRGAMKK
jgi:hypothetical protein